jgi:predicted RNA-binding protein with PIN domain
MERSRMFVDGYSLLHRWRAGPFADAAALRVVRDALVARLAEWQAWLGANMTAVFDGQQGGVDAGASRPGFQVIYTAGESADTYIEREALRETRHLRLLVVSSDLAVLHTVAARGGQAITCEEFLRRVQGMGGAVRKARQGRATPRPYPPRLGDFFPPR